MKRLSVTMLVVPVTLAILTSVGCAPSQEPVATPASTDANTEHGAGGSDMEKMKVELSKLSREDAASAEKQHFCPVTSKMLGTMGAPKKVDVDGRQVWICCEGCRVELLANSEKYLAKLTKE